MVEVVPAGELLAIAPSRPARPQRHGLVRSMHRSTERIDIGTPEAPSVTTELVAGQLALVRELVNRLHGAPKNSGDVARVKVSIWGHHSSPPVRMKWSTRLAAMTARSFAVAAFANG